MAREAWTDERLDDLRENVNQRFDQVDKGLGRLDDKFTTMQRETTARFDAMQRNMTTWAVALFSTIVTLNAAIIAAVFSA